YKRDAADNLVLEPKIASLRYRSRAAGASSVALGALSGDLYITDDTIEFRQLHLAAQKAFIEARALVTPAEDHRLAGALEFGIQSDSPYLPSWLALPVEGRADLSGEFSTPVVDGALALTEGESAALRYNGDTLLSFSTGT